MLNRLAKKVEPATGFAGVLFHNNPFYRSTSKLVTDSEDVNLRNQLTLLKVSDLAWRLLLAQAIIMTIVQFWLLARGSFIIGMTFFGLTMLLRYVVPARARKLLSTKNNGRMLRQFY